MISAIRRLMRTPTRPGSLDATKTNRPNVRPRSRSSRAVLDERTPDGCRGRPGTDQGHRAGRYAKSYSRNAIKPVPSRRRRDPARREETTPPQKIADGSCLKMTGRSRRPVESPPRHCSCCDAEKATADVIAIVSPSHLGVHWSPKSTTDSARRRFPEIEASSQRSHARERGKKI